MISVIMPTYNERGNISSLIERTAKALKKNFEIIVVDDSSPDATDKLVKKLQKSRPYLRLIVRRERGLPGAIKRGIDEAKGRNVAWLDCDLGMPPEKLPEMIALLDNNDLVVASTFLRGAKDARKVIHAEVFSTIINLLARIVLGGKITDYTSGFAAARKKALETTRFAGTHGTYFMGMIYDALKNGERVTEIPYTLEPRHYGQSKIAGFWPYFKTGLIYLKELLKIRLMH